MKQGWEIKKLGEVCDILDSQRKPVTKKDRKEGQYPYYGATGIQDYVDSYIFDGRYLLLGEDGAKWGAMDKSAFIIEGKCWVNNHAHILKVHDCLIDTFAEYYLVFKDLDEYITGAIVRKLTQQALRDIPMLVPPIAEQKKIVAELDCLSGIIEKKKQQLKELDALAQSIFYEMFGDPVENDKRWDVKRIEDICDVYRGGSPRPIDKFLGGNIPWIKIGDATLGDSIFLTQTKEHIIEEGLRKTRFIHSGSLIFANCGVSLGFARIITFDGCIHDGWLAFDNVSEEIDKIFFLKSLNFCTPYFRSIAPDGVQPNLNTSIMKAFKQILPPLSMQKDYVDKIQAIEKQKLLITESLVQAEMLLNSRMDYYFN